MTAAPPIVGTETYISYAAATSLAADRLNSADWQAAVDDHEAELASDPTAPPAGTTIPVLCRQALMTATATLDRLSWVGVPTASPQALAWPRRDNRGARYAYPGIYDTWSTLATPFGDPAFPSDVIPAPIATACAELAFYLISPEGRGNRPGVQLAMIGQAMETYFPSVADELPKHVRRLVEPFLRVRSSHSVELLP